jgi:hypothetical protein
VRALSLRERPVHGKGACAFDHNQYAERNGQQMVFVTFTLLVSVPVHEDAVVHMNQANGDEHVHGNSECGNPRKEADDQSDPSKKLRRDGKKGEHRWNAHVNGEKVHGGVEAISSKLGESLLRAMHKKDNAEYEADQGKGMVISAFASARSTVLRCTWKENFF